MAARESQGYLIAVIILILLSLVLALGFVWALLRGNEHWDARAKAEQTVAFQENQLKAQETLTDVILAYLGDMGVSLAETESSINNLRRLTTNVDDNQRMLINTIIERVDQVTAEYRKDMQMMLTPSTAEQSREPTYRGLLADYRAAIGRKHAENDQMRTDTKRIEEEKRAAVAALEAAVAKLQSDIEAERNSYAQEKQRLTEEQRRLSASLDEAKRDNQRISRDFENSRQDFQLQRSRLEETVAKTTDENRKLKEKINEYEREVFELADGKIVGVATNLGRVFLNIGSADSLRTNMTFSVYDRTATNFERDRPKATIEVVRITGPHQSEARVVHENPRDPITVDDQVLNPVWEPNYRRPIALAGVFDLDFDGINDVDVLRARIEQNGGRVVAYHDDQGNIVGEIDSKTRWLVRGDNPSVGGSFDPRISKAISELTKQANENFVEQIDTRQLLNWMGTHGKADVEHFGRGENPLMRTDSNQFRRQPGDR